MDGVGCRPGDACDARPRRVRRAAVRRHRTPHRDRPAPTCRPRQFYDDPNGVHVNRDCGVLRRQRRDNSDRIGDDLRQVLGRKFNDGSERIHDERRSGLLECQHHADSDRVDLEHGDGVIRRRIDDSPKHLERTRSPTGQGGGVLAAAVPPRAARDHAAGARARGRHPTRYPVLRRTRRFLGYAFARASRGLRNSGSNARSAAPTSTGSSSAPGTSAISVVCATSAPASI